MKLIFRETLPSDVEGLFSVRARTRENPISKEQLASLGITAESIAKQMASGRMKGWVCLDSSTLVGFCNGDAETGEVLVLAVLPDYERKGIGTYLLSRVVEWLRSADRAASRPGPTPLACTQWRKPPSPLRTADRSSIDRHPRYFAGSVYAAVRHSHTGMPIGRRSFRSPSRVSTTPGSWYRSITRGWRTRFPD
jgi:Acetyltransferase (GNAT) domain